MRAPALQPSLRTRTKNNSWTGGEEMGDDARDLHRFSEMDDVEVAEDDPDVRGWDVVTRDGQDIGEVKDLLVDTRSMKVRSLEVELEGSHFKWNDNRRVAIPVDWVRLDEEHDDVVIEGREFDEIGRLQEYRPG
jgi:sporulation protein YlmC with PRC-barrel domain